MDWPEVPYSVECELNSEQPISCLTKVSTAAPSSVGVVEINRKFARSRASFNWEGTNPEIISPVDFVIDA